MPYPFGLILLASLATASEIQRSSVDTTHTPAPSIVELPKGPNGLTIYNAKGDIVAKCERKNGAFGDCKMEPGVTLDDLMNAWVHAYLEVQK